MPTLKNRYSGRLRTPLSESTPSQMPPSVIFTLLYIEKFLNNRCNSIATATAQMAVTTQPVNENPLSMRSIEVPVLRKNVPKVLISSSSIMPEYIITISVSTARSVTTVPRAFENDMPSYRFSMAHRENSPMRGITKLAA